MKAMGHLLRVSVLASYLFLARTSVASAGGEATSSSPREGKLAYTSSASTAPAVTTSSRPAWKLSARLVAQAEPGCEVVLRWISGTSYANDEVLLPYQDSRRGGA